MAYCEDYPCCGHSPEDPCPRRTKTGRIIPTCCVCGKRLQKDYRSSICKTCYSYMQRRDEYGYGD